VSETPAPAERKGALSVRSATFLGIGSMIGAGIFALLGEAGGVAGAAVWLSFLIGGVVATLLGYVCVNLGDDQGRRLEPALVRAGIRRSRRSSPASRSRSSPISAST
jgi:hypothetical protein